MTESTAAFWDEQAATFDDEADHGLRDPAVRAGSFDVVLARHVLWALPDPAAALARWTRLLRPAGSLLLVEGRWATGAGISAGDCEALVLEQRQEASVSLLDDALLWGRPIEDERYLLVSRR